MGEVGTEVAIANRGPKLWHKVCLQLAGMPLACAGGSGLGLARGLHAGDGTGIASPHGRLVPQTVTMPFPASDGDKFWHFGGWGDALKLAKIEKTLHFAMCRYFGTPTMAKLGGIV